MAVGRLDRKQVEPFETTITILIQVVVELDLIRLELKHARRLKERTLAILEATR